MPLKDPDETHTLHRLTIEIAVIQAEIKAGKEAIELASTVLERRLMEQARSTFALREDLQKLWDDHDQIKLKFVNRELHDRLVDEISEVRQNLSNWQGRLLMVAWLVTAIAAVASISVTAYHLFVPAVH